MSKEFNKKLFDLACVVENTRNAVSQAKKRAQMGNVAELEEQHAKAALAYNKYLNAGTGKK